MRVAARATDVRSADRILCTVAGLFASYAHFDDNRNNPAAGTIDGPGAIGIRPVPVCQLMEHGAGYYLVFDSTCPGGAAAFDYCTIRRRRDPAGIPDIDRGRVVYGVGLCTAEQYGGQ